MTIKTNTARTSASEHPSTPDASGQRASASRQARSSRSRGESPLTSAGAPRSAPPRAATGNNARVRINTTRIFEDHSVSVKVSDMPHHAPGEHAADPRIGSELVAVVTTTLDKMKAGDVKERLPAAMADKMDTGHWMSDSHFHPTNYTQQGMTPLQMLKMMDEVGIHRSVMSPIPTDVMPCGSHGDHNHIPPESYYVPAKYANIKPQELTAEIEQEISQSSHLMLNQQVDADTALFVDVNKTLNTAQRDRIDPMVTGLHLGSPLSPQALLFKLAAHKGVFTGVGEVTIHKELVESQYEGARQANLTNNVQSFKNLVATAGVIGMPVVLHCDVDSTANQRANGRGKPEHLGNLKDLFASPEVRDTTLIWAHCGGVGRFVQKPIDHANNLRAILSDPEMKHINVDISWSRVARQIVFKTGADGKDVPDHESVHAWASLINDHPDRFLFGSDALNPLAKETWAETGMLYKPLLEALTPEARIAVKTGNYERLLVGARDKVRTFEQHALTPEFQERLRSSGADRINAGPHIDPAALRAARDEAYQKAGVDLHGKPTGAVQQPAPQLMEQGASSSKPAKAKETPAQIRAHLTTIKAQQDARLDQLTASGKKPSRMRRLFGAK